MHFLIEMRFFKCISGVFCCLSTSLVFFFSFFFFLFFFWGGGGGVLSTRTLNNLLHVDLLWFCRSYSLAVPLAVILFTAGNRFIDTCCDVQPGGREYL